MGEIKFLEKASLLSMGVYLQIAVRITLLDDAIIRCNEPEEVLTHNYKLIGRRFIIPPRKVKAKLRRLTLEKQRGLGIQPECSLKDDLCMMCPTCFLFGGTGETSSVDVSYNILSRVYGETFISETQSIEPLSYTANAVDEKELNTGQALMTIVTVPKETTFLGVITLKDPTKEMASIIIDNINRITRIGARNNEWGRCSTEILGYYLGDREILNVYLSNVDVNNMQKHFNFNPTSLPDVEQSYKILFEQVKGILSKLNKEKKGKNKTENYQEE